jgi:hypothetical protein
VVVEPDPDPNAIEWLPMAGTGDEFKPPKLPKLELPPEFRRRFKLSATAVERLKALVPPGLAQKLQQLARSNRPLTSDIRDMIDLVLKRHQNRAELDQEIRQLELWLDEQVSRERWDPAREPSPSSTPVLTVTPKPKAKPKAKPTASKGRKARAQQEITRCVKIIYPDGSIPRSLTGGGLERKIAALYKTETPKNEKPPDPPSEDSCDRWLKDHRSIS